MGMYPHLVQEHVMIFKRYGETLCYIYNQMYNLPIRIVRPFNNYGPFLSGFDKRLPSDLLNTFLKNEDIILFSDGKPKGHFAMYQMLYVVI